METLPSVGPKSVRNFSDHKVVTTRNGSVDRGQTPILLRIENSIFDRSLDPMAMLSLPLPSLPPELL